MAWLSSASAQGARERMTGPGASSDGLTVADAMVSYPKQLPLAATVGDARRLFRDDHVHAALIVTEAGCLAAVVERCDISGSPAPDDARAAPFGRLAGVSSCPGPA
jgi:hypothetical protein